MDEQTVSVTLSTDVIYVSGTVNGVEYTWTNTDENRWEAVVVRSESDIYVVALTLINAMGTTTNAYFTLYYGALNLITDRTEQDVERWRQLRAKGYAAMTEEEKAEWDAGMKGAYNYVDMNRVEGAVAYLLGRMKEHGQALNLTVEPSWAVDSHPTKRDMARYFLNVARLRSVFPRYPTTPLAPTVSKRFDYIAANELEQILVDVDRRMTGIEQCWYYAGDVFTGEV